MHNRNRVRLILFHFKIQLSVRGPEGKPACEEGNYSILSMSKQSLRRDIGSGQLCSETDSSVCGSAADAPVSFEPAGSLLEWRAEEPNIALESCDTSYLSMRVLEEVDCETWVSDCKWS